MQQTINAGDVPAVAGSRAAQAEPAAHRTGGAEGFAGQAVDSASRQVLIAISPMAGFYPGRLSEECAAAGFRQGGEGTRAIQTIILITGRGDRETATGSAKVGQ